MASRQEIFHDVRKYPASNLQVSNDGVRVPVTYKRSWDDEYGARGWKLNVTIGDPAIIASTRQTGDRINTSVLIHDVLDHFISGFGVSGHRSEAMALCQLAQRTGSNPRPDYEQMVIEDIEQGRVNGESLLSFLPASLVRLLQYSHGLSHRQVIDGLQGSLGKAGLREQLVLHFFDIGKEGSKHAEKSWESLGLAYSRRTEIGIAVQSLLDVVDAGLEESGLDMAKAYIQLGNKTCKFVLQGSGSDVPPNEFEAGVSCV